MKDVQTRIDALVRTLARKEAFIQRLSDGLAPLRNKLQRLTNQRTLEVQKEEKAKETVQP